MDAAWRDGHLQQKAGVVFGKFISQRMAQLNLFDENAPRANLFRRTEFPAGIADDVGDVSPCYTTRLEDVPVARAD
ncbi:hypothetical protein RA241_000192 [Cronobacter sakazakii]|nr:hypothetical protein [Cronobacter sakazakii]ELY5817181.1 hypothetical protein [Cronobacter turicensis]EKM5752865.1 hypothetical protein [Cronobacter sakazakii]EKY1951021.1 hypothetical protein [Cronobacter sakazakii]EKY1958234.1 hypothetical protein [Cronobacter sakazakii]